MRVLVIGCGSIGTRHIKNLTNLNQIEKIFICTGIPDPIEKFENKEKLEIVGSIGNLNFDFAIVANETHKHIETAQIFAEQGKHLFIEKPLSLNLNGIVNLQKTVQKNNCKVFLAYNLRFLGAIQVLKDILSKKEIGDLYFAKIEFGHYLPFWGLKRDYRQNFRASRKKGGGVALDFTHEIDYMRYLFGQPKRWKVLKTKVSELEINTDDLFEGIYEYESGFLCNVHLDFLQNARKREIRIVGSAGSLMCDFVGRKIKLNVNDKETLWNNNDLFDIDKTYRDELNHFIRIIENKEPSRVTLDDGIRAIELVNEQHV